MGRGAGGLGESKTAGEGVSGEGWAATILNMAFLAHIPLNSCSTVVCVEVGETQKGMREQV